jgi:hypothetical protein
MKKKRGLTIKINLSNRWLYFLITLGILMIVAVGVYAASYSSSGAGHPITEISTCPSNGQILKMSGGVWTCGTDVDTDTTVGDGGTVFKNIRLFKEPDVCHGDYTFEESCATRSCRSYTITDPYGGTSTVYYYYSCSGSCKSTYTSPYTCSNSFQGYILTYIPNK